MAEAILYVNRYGVVHTGHLREAGSDLAYQQLKVVGDFREKAGGANPALNQLPDRLLTRTLIGLFVLSERRISDWRKARSRFSKLLWEADFMENPERVSRQLSELLERSRQLVHVQEAKGFLDLANKRINFLLSEKAQLQLGSRRWTTMVFAEDYALQRVARDGTFFYGEARL